MDDCIFCKIVAGKIPSKKVYEDEEMLAFHDINPQAPVHFVIVPKVHVDSLAHVGPEHAPVLGKMLAVAGRLRLRVAAAFGVGGVALGTWLLAQAMTLEQPAPQLLVRFLQDCEAPLQVATPHVPPVHHAERERLVARPFRKQRSQLLRRARKVEVTRAANSFGRTHLPEINRAYESIAKIISDGQRSGEFRDDVDPLLASMWFYGAIEQLLSGWIFGYLPTTDEEFERAKSLVVETICGGLEATPAGDPAISG